MPRAENELNVSKFSVYEKEMKIMKRTIKMACEHCVGNLKSRLGTGMVWLQVFGVSHNASRRFLLQDSV